VRVVLLLLLSVECAFATSVPTVTLSDQRSLAGWLGSPVGNVRLNGKPLTSGATAQLPEVNRTGWVGWIDCSEEHHPARLRIVQGVPVGSRLILRNPSGSLRAIPAGKPIIEAWGFTPDGLHVVVKSRALHGPAVIERFRMKDGTKAGTCPAFGNHLPSWTAGYQDR
jgi:hypothetical protein